MARIFISYTRADGSDLAQMLKQGLEELGYEVFLDIDDIPGGRDWEHYLKAEVARSDILLALVTPESKDSKYVFVEYEQARDQRKAVIPLVMGKTPLPGYLHQWNAIYLDPDNPHRSLLRLERSIREIIFNPTAVPQSPPALAGAPDRTLGVYRLALGGLVVALGVCLALLAIVLSRLPAPPASRLTSARAPLSARPAAGYAEITAPADGAENIQAAWGVLVNGTYSPELEGQALWLLVFTDDSYWPQTTDGCRPDDPIALEARQGIWQAKIVLGTPNTQYDIVLVSTAPDGRANREFWAWQSRACQIGDYPPFKAADLPAGLVELDAVTVRTR